MACIELINVSKRFGRSFWAVSALTLSVGDGEFVILVGPSGCGKSTVLRMIAGLETITSGEFRMDGRRMNEVEPQDRGLAMVFQNYALYPHLSVYENLAFPLRLRKLASAPLAERVRKTARALGIEPLLERMPRELSGGQRQRVALGRAMVREPKAFLFDEPLSNLDARLRLDMRVEIAELHQRLGTTFLYVTHDQVEAMTLGQRIVVLRDGRLQQCAAPEDLYAFPANRFVAGFIGAPPMNFIEAELACESGVWVAVHDPFRVRLPASAALRLERHGPGRVAMGIRPGDLRLQGSPEAAGLRHGVPLAGRFLLRETLGEEVLYYVELASARMPRPSVIVKAVSPFPFARHAPVELVLDPARIHLFDAGTGGSLLEVRGQT